MLTIAKRDDLVRRLESIEKNGGAEAALASIVRELLVDVPTETEYAASVKAALKAQRANQ